MRKFFCIICDVIKFRKNMICGYCENKIGSRKKAYFLRYEEKVPHYYLFEWNLETDFFCRKLVCFLKHQKVDKFKEWTYLFPSQISFIGSRVAFVPKSSSQKTLNHAKELALSLKKLLNLKSILEIDETFEAQKKKTRINRLKVKKNFKKKIRLDYQWVFIDDVFVTGATYGRIKSEIENLPEMIVTLFYKSLIKGEERNVF